MNHPEFALHYIARVVSGTTNDPSDVNSKPPLSVALHLKAWVLISHVAYALMPNPHVISSSDAISVNAFIALTLPKVSLDMNSLTASGIISLFEGIESKTNTVRSIVANASVSPFARLYYPIDGEPFNPDIYGYKADHHRQSLLTLAFTKSKTKLQTGMGFELDLIDGIGKRVCFSFLELMASHLEDEFPISPSLVSGLLSFKHYAFIADLLGLELAEPGKYYIPETLRLSPKSTLAVREGLIDASRTLIMMYLNCCAECYENIGSSMASELGDDVLLCDHGFSYGS